VSAGAFHFRVRDGNGWVHPALATKAIPSFVSAAVRRRVGHSLPPPCFRTAACDIETLDPILKARDTGGGAASHSAIGAARLHLLPGFHVRPINHIVCVGPYSPMTRRGGTHLGACFALRCIQRLSRPDVGYPAMPLARQPVHRRSVRPGPLVLGAGLRSPPSPATDRDRTVSRRSEPSSRAALMGEQPNPWDLLRPQDATSRHRGAKPCRRCGLSGKISLLSPG
jgi:hypothetical protein